MRHLVMDYIAGQWNIKALAERSVETKIVMDPFLKRANIHSLSF